MEDSTCLDTKFFHCNNLLNINNKISLFHQQPEMVEEGTVAAVQSVTDRTSQLAANQSEAGASSAPDEGESSANRTSTLVGGESSARKTSTLTDGQAGPGGSAEPPIKRSRRPNDKKPATPDQSSSRSPTVGPTVESTDGPTVGREQNLQNTRTADYYEFVANQFELCRNTVDNLIKFYQLTHTYRAFLKCDLTYSYFRDKCSSIKRHLDAVPEEGSLFL